MNFGKIVIGAVAILGITTAQAQFGVKAGLGMASVHGNKATEDVLDGSILAPMVGVTYHLTLGPIGVKPEVMLVKKGASGEFDFGTDKIEVTSNLWYIDAPLLGSFSILPTLSIIGGPSIGYLLSSKTEIDGEEEDNKDNTESMNMGAVLGVQFMLPIAGLGVDARYQYGISNISKADGSEVSTDMMAITATYLF